jgi:hypothetical protein
VSVREREGGREGGREGEEKREMESEWEVGTGHERERKRERKREREREKEREGKHIAHAQAQAHYFVRFPAQTTPSKRQKPVQCLIKKSFMSVVSSI